MRRKLALLLTLGLGIHSAFAVDEMLNTKEKNQILSSIKDVEITDTLKKTSEYSECAKHYTFDATKGSTGLDAAQKCFVGKISTTTDPKKLEELSSKLGLQQYGLIQSNSQKEIQSYLNDKLYEALTGVDRREKNQEKLLKSMKYDQMKQVDQSVFIKLYKNQIVKNALAEVSRFCFEKLRNGAIDKSITRFDEHWKSYDPSVGISAATVNDSGEPPFTTFTDLKDDKQIYKEIFESIKGNFSEQQLSGFFEHCGKLIPKLCKDFRDNQAVANSQEISSSASMPNGAAACLAQSRIRDFKKAVVAADLIIADFDNLSKDEIKGLMLTIEGSTNIYGQGPNDKSIDELTNLASTDVLLHSGSDDEKIKLANDCEKNNDKEACEAFLIQGDSLDKAKHNIELQMSYKREVEKKLVSELKKKNDDSLEKYLKANGFMDLLENDKYKTMDEKDLVAEIGKSFDAKKAALLYEINNKLGSRQMKSGDDVQAKVAPLLEDVKSEKARMTQVVLFHNVISSFLNLKLEDDPTASGRNIETWKIEEKGLKAAGVDESNFKNITENHADAKKLDSKKSTMQFSFLEQFLK